MRPRCIASPHGWIAILLACAAPTVRADSIYLNDAGRQNLDVLRLRIAPAPIFEDAARKLSYIRCTIVGERPAREPSARYDTLEGRPEIDFVAFDASGDQRSATVTINTLWIHHVDLDYDSELDVRALFSDRDLRAGIALASRAYFAMARRAGDPQGKLGLWRNDLALPAEPAGVNEGIVVRFLLDPPVFDSSVDAAKWSARKSAEVREGTKKLLERRLPGLHRSDVDGRPSLMVPKLIDAVARERAYRLSRAGFDRAALSMLVFMLDLATVRHREKPAGDDPADAIYFEGLRSVVYAVETIGRATPDDVGHADPPELIQLFHRYRAAKDTAERQKIAVDYNALQNRVAPAGRTSCIVHPQFCVDASQRAAVAIDALAASEGVYVAENHWLHLADALVRLHVTPAGPNPHKNERVDLRDASFKLLVQLVDPPASPDGERQANRQQAAKSVRAELYRLLILDRTTAMEADVVRRAFAAGGWGSAAELNGFVKTMMSHAWSITRESARKAREREIAARHIATLRAIAELAGSQAEHERAAANEVLNHVQEMRENQREKLRADPTNAAFLEIWDDPATAAPRAMP